MTVLGLIFFVLSVIAELQAFTRRVPADYTTIQSALDACVESDTILVDTGIYAEALVAPPFSFVLIGSSAVDSLRPIVDPGTLLNPQSQRCLLLTGGTCEIENFVFRNGAGMHPHDEGQVGGIECNAPLVNLTNCLFDSVHIGLYSAQGGVAYLSNCEMRSSIYYGIRYLSPGRVVARACEFGGDEITWSLVTGYDSSSFVDCSFFGSPLNAHLLLVAGSNVEVSRCHFASASSSSWELVWASLYESRLDSNVFSDCALRPHLINLQVPCGHHVSVQGNLFSEIRSRPGIAGGRGSCIVVFQVDQEDNPCEGTVVEGNSFLSCEDGNSGKGILFRAGLDCFHNQFVQMEPETTAVVFAGSSGSQLRENIFRSNGLAVDGDPLRFIDADWNYWGDSTGPYHPTLNPSGLGDEVGDFIDIDPWYTDTLFWNSASPEPRPQLPRDVTLSVSPNPFNAMTTLELFVPKAQIVEVKLYDLLGREISALYKGPAIDAKRIAVNGADLASGIYFARASDPIRRRSLAEVKLLLVK